MPNRYRPDYRRGNDKTNWGLYLFLFFMFGGGLISSVIGLISVLMPFLIFGLIFYFAFGYDKNRSTYTSPNKNAKERSYKTNNYKSRYQTVNNGPIYGRGSTQRPTYSKKDIQLVDEKLANYFDKNEKLPVINDINLRLKGSAYISLKSLNVYMKDDYVCSLEEFGAKYTDIYDQVIKWLIAFSNERDTSNIFDAQATTKKDEKVKEEAVSVDSFIKKINDLNTEIPDEAISNGLYETSALLKQIGEIENKFPGKSEKLNKLYKYYLPMLVNNLNQYKELQSAQTNENFESTKEKLQKNVTLINEAMKTLAASLCEEDFINLSADISTLESLLKKDGLAGENRMSQFKGGVSDE